jgi:hypothetical protein
MYSSPRSAFSFPFPPLHLSLLPEGPKVSLEIREGRSKDSNVPVAGVTSGVLLGVGLAGQAKSGEVIVGAVEPLAAMLIKAK